MLVLLPCTTAHHLPPFTRIHAWRRQRYLPLASRPDSPSAALACHRVPACLPCLLALVLLQGRYVSISAESKVGLCLVEVYPLLTNAAVGKATSASAGTGDSDQAAQVVTNGDINNNACATVVSGPDLSAWITIDLGYEAPVETVVVYNGDSNFNNDLYIRWVDGWMGG